MRSRESEVMVPQKIWVELGVAPATGGALKTFVRGANWDHLPRVGDYVELFDDAATHAQVERVVFCANESVRIILATYDDHDADAVIAKVRADQRRWKALE